jgi:hypothetical protein
MLNSVIQDEITRLSLILNIDSSFLEEFALFVVKSSKIKPAKTSARPSKAKQVKPLALNVIKMAVFNYFNSTCTIKDFIDFVTQRYLDQATPELMNRLFQAQKVLKSEH